MFSLGNFIYIFFKQYNSINQLYFLSYIETKENLYMISNKIKNKMFILCRVEPMTSKSDKSKHRFSAWLGGTRDLRRNNCKVLSILVPLCKYDATGALRSLSFLTGLLKSTWEENDLFWNYVVPKGTRL